MTKARFFYALRPDPDAADELAAIAVQAAARWGGHAFAAPDIHLTLAFVGMLPVEQQPALQAILHGMPARFDVSDTPRMPGVSHVPDASGREAMPALALARLGSFGHGVLWIGPERRADQPAPARSFVHALAREIQSRLRAAQVAFDERPLKLHATIVRGARGFGDDRRKEPADATDAGDTGARPLRAASSPIVASLPIVARAWSLALGASDGASTPQRRYRWWLPTESASAT